MTELVLKGKSRDTEALRLRITGWDLDSIAQHLGWDKPSKAASAIKRAVSNMSRFAGDEQRLLELQKLDQYEKECWTLLRRTHWAFSNRGDLLRDPNGQPVEDSRVSVEILDRLVKIAERRAKLMGLDAPLRAEVLTIDSVDAEIARLEAELALARQPGQIAVAAKALEQGQQVRAEQDEPEPEPEPEFVDAEIVDEEACDR